MAALAAQIAALKNSLAREALMRTPPASLQDGLDRLTDHLLSPFGNPPAVNGMRTIDVAGVDVSIRTDGEAAYIGMLSESGRRTEARVTTLHHLEIVFYDTVRGAERLSAALMRGDAVA